MNAPENPGLGVGLHVGLPMDRYITDPCAVPSLSGSIVHELLTTSPRHAWFRHPRLNPKHRREERGLLDVGSAAHALLLEGDETKLCSIDPRDYTGARGGVPKGWTNDAIKAARDDARAKGLIPLLRADAEACSEMLAVAHEFIAGSELAGIFENGASEQTMIWTEGPTWFRARPDWLTPDGRLVMHYKTTKRAAEPDSFGRMMISSMGYDTAAVFYERGVLALPEGTFAGRDEPMNPDEVRSVFLVQEQDPPYCCSLIGLDPELHALAYRKVEHAIQLWAHSMKTGKWPAYPSRICYVGAKPWQVADFETREYMTPLVGEVDPVQQQYGLEL